MLQFFKVRDKSERRLWGEVGSHFSCSREHDLESPNNASSSMALMKTTIPVFHA